MIKRFKNEKSNRSSHQYHRVLAPNSDERLHSFKNGTPIKQHCNVRRPKLALVLFAVFALALFSVFSNTTRATTDTNLLRLLENDVVFKASTMTVLVISKRSNGSTRNVIRETWAKGYKNVKFLVGESCPIPPQHRTEFTCHRAMSSSEEELREWMTLVNNQDLTLDEEQRLHHDLIRCPMVDVYYNLALKVKYGYNWVIQNTDAEWIVKINDDTVIHLDKLEYYLTEDFNSERPVIVGSILKGARIPKSGKRAERTYSKEVYPSFPQGSFGHCISRPIAKYISEHKETLYNYLFEDISIGIWMDESPLRDQIEWVTTKHATNISDWRHACKDKTMFMIGGNIPVDGIRWCISQDTWNQPVYQRAQYQKFYLEESALPPERQFYEVAAEVADALDSLEVPWWTTEGTLAGILRWGNNFAVSSHNIFVTDDDIDVMVEISSEQHWDHIKATLRSRFKKGSDSGQGWVWKECKEYNHGTAPVRQTAKFTCYTSASFQYGSKVALGMRGDIHVDFHSYFVSTDRSTAAIDPVCLEVPSKCRKHWPFQAWGGAAPYRGLIVDADDQFSKGRFGSMVWRTPYKAVSLLAKWNNGEYDFPTQHLPPSGYCLSGSKSEPVYELVKVNLSAKDILLICEHSLKQKLDGFVSFSAKFSRGCEAESRAAGLPVTTPVIQTEYDRMCLASTKRCRTDEHFECSPREEPTVPTNQPIKQRKIWLHDHESGSVSSFIPKEKCNSAAQKRWFLPVQYKRKDLPNDPVNININVSPGQCDTYNRAAFLSGKVSWIIDLECGRCLEAKDLYKQGYNMLLTESGPNFDQLKKEIMETSRYIQTGGEGVHFVRLSLNEFEVSEASSLFSTIPHHVFDGAVVSSVDVIEHVAMPHRILALVEYLFKRGADTYVLSTPERDMYHGMGRNAQLWKYDEFVSLLACSAIPGDIHTQWTQNYEVNILAVITSRSFVPWPFEHEIGYWGKSLHSSPSTEFPLLLPNVVEHCATVDCTNFEVIEFDKMTCDEGALGLKLFEEASIYMMNFRHACFDDTIFSENRREWAQSKKLLELKSTELGFCDGSGLGGCSGGKGGYTTSGSMLERLKSASKSSFPSVSSVVRDDKVRFIVLATYASWNGDLDRWDWEFVLDGIFANPFFVPVLWGIGYPDYNVNKSPLQNLQSKFHDLDKHNTVVYTFERYMAFLQGNCNPRGSSSAFQDYKDLRLHVTTTQWFFEPYMEMVRIKQYIEFDINVWALQPVFKFMVSPGDSYTHTWLPACNSSGLIGPNDKERKTLCHHFNKYNIGVSCKASWEGRDSWWNWIHPPVREFHVNAWIPQGISKSQYQQSSPLRTNDFFLFGGIDRDYPLRQALLHVYENEKNLLAKEGIKMSRREHPGYDVGQSSGKFALGVQTQVQHYISDLLQSKVCLIGGHGAWGLRKYIEAMAAGCLVLGDLPMDAELAKCVIEMKWGPPKYLVGQMKSTMERYKMGKYTEHIKSCRMFALQKRNFLALSNEYVDAIRLFRKKQKPAYEWFDSIDRSSVHIRGTGTNPNGSIRIEDSIDFVIPSSMGVKADGGDESYDSIRRDRDNGELKFVLRSVVQNASWVRRIFILVNGRVEIPESWQEESFINRIYFIDRCGYMPEGTCPTRNAFSVYGSLHLFPELSEKFVIAEDDTYLGIPVSPSFFFASDGRPYVFSRSGMADIYDRIPQELVGKAIPRRSKDGSPHFYFPMLKSVARSIAKQYPDYYQFLLSHKDGRYSSLADGVDDKRNPLEEDTFCLWQGQLLESKRGVYKNIMYDGQGLQDWEGDPDDPLALARVFGLQPLPIFINTNDVYSIDPETYRDQQQRVVAYLETAFPKRISRQVDGVDLYGF